MDSFIKEINNRDLALITWIVFAIIAFLFFKGFRKFIADISKIIFCKSFLVIYSILLVYSYLLLIGLYKIKFWDYSLIKDTFFWFVGTGIVLIMSSLNSDNFKIKRIITNSIKITILVEFIVNLHVFSYLFELIFFPVLIFLSLSLAISETEKKLEPAAKFLRYLFGIMGLIVFMIALYKTIQSYKQDFTFDNLRKLILPSILTFLFIPLSYVLAVYSAYELLFVLLINLKNEKWTKSKIKFEIILNAKLNLWRIRTIRRSINLYDLTETNDLRLYIKNLKKPVANK